jgi:hypothetical protein
VVAVEDSSRCPFAQPPSKEAEPVQAVLVLALGHSRPPALHAPSQFFCAQALKSRSALAHAGSSSSWPQAEDAIAEQLRLPPGQTQVR